MEIKYYKIEKDFVPNHIRGEYFKGLWLNNPERFKQGRYICEFYYKNGYHCILIGTPELKQEYILAYELGKLDTVEVSYEDIKFLHPHLHRFIKKRST